jgi:hypothetical protein
MGGEAAFADVAVLDGTNNSKLVAAAGQRFLSPLVGSLFVVQNP